MYNTQAKRNAAATENLLSALENTNIGGSNPDLASAIASSRAMLQGPPSTSQGKRKVQSTPTPQPRNNAEASSSSNVNMNTDIGGGRTLGDILKSLDDANKAVQELQRQNQTKYEAGFKEAVQTMAGKK